MSDDKLSEEGLREEIKNLLSWGHAHDYDDILREARITKLREAAEAIDTKRGALGMMGRSPDFLEGMNVAIRHLLIEAATLEEPQEEEC